MNKKIDFENQIELWLCDDCVVIEVNDDATSFDYYYSPKEAKRRLKAVQEGLTSLWEQGRLACDDSPEPQMECRDCWHVGLDTTFELKEEGEEEGWVVLCRVCPKCGSTDTQERDAGREEFGTWPCDCCGSELAGQRTRYALFPYVEEEA